jgi:hypothetical protein
VPEDAEQTFWSDGYTISSIYVAQPVPACKIIDMKILNDIFTNMSGLIAGRQLLGLGSGIAAPLALIITQLHLSVKPEASEAEWEALRSLRGLCAAETQKSSRTVRNWLSRFALHVSDICWLRLDEDGYSVCSVDMVVEVRFLLIELLLEEMVRVWFRYPANGVSSLFTMDLSVEEFFEVGDRISFLKRVVWNSGTGQSKAISCRVKLLRINPYMVIKASEPHSVLTHGRFMFTSNPPSQAS